MLDSLEGLDDAVKDLYSKHTDGKFYLDVEGAVSKSKVDEFRDNNVSLKQQIEEMTDKFGNVDLDKYTALMEKEALDDGKKRITMEKVDEIVAERTRAMKAEHDNQLQALMGANEGLNGQLNGLLIDGAIRSAAAEAKVRGAAMEDVVLRAKQTFQVVDGKAVAHDADGKVIYGKDGSNPLSTSEWISGLKTTADHLFESSKGGGAGGGDQKPNSQQNVTDTTGMSPLQKISAGMTASE
jgi:hypothetical protein